MRLKSDLIEVCLAACEGKLEDVTLKWDPRPAVCVVMASGGYPGDYEKGKVITGIEDAEEDKCVKVFHAGTKEVEGDLVTSGGRVLGVTAMGDDIAKAQAAAYKAVERIKFEGAYYRRDIADKAISTSK
ncbi:MAG: phosphoribosylglycinamide synthetase C domain-containing protein [Planctomycetota bacterium]